MRLVNALKTVCDFLLFLSFAALFTACSEAWLLVGAALALAFLSSLLLQMTSRAMPARIFCGLLPALCLFAARDLSQVLITAVVLVFYAVLTISDKNVICYDDYKYWFGIPAIPVTVLFLICFTSWPIRRLAVVCAALYLFLGILTLRRMRLGAGAGLGLRLTNLAELAGIILFGTLACFLIILTLQYAKKILELLALPLGALLSGLIYLADLINRRLASIALKSPDEPLLPDEPAEEPWEDTPRPEIEVTDPGSDAVYTQAGMLVKVFLIVLALAVLLYLLYRFYIMIRYARPESGSGSEIESGSRGQLRFRLRQRKNRKASSSSNNEKIRQIYREYLVFLRGCGVELSRQTTSEDIMAASDGLVSSEDAEKLRDLYIHARYQDAEELSDADVKQASALLVSFREQFEASKAGFGTAAN